MNTRIVVQAGDPQLCELVRELLEPYRYEVLTAADPQATAQHVRSSGPPALIVVLDREATSELQVGLGELTPDVRILRLPGLQVKVQEQGPGPRIEAAGVDLDPTELACLLDQILAIEHQDGSHDALLLRSSLIETIVAYSLLLEQHQFLNGGNQRLVMQYAIRLAAELGLAPVYRDQIAFAALLQDIGLAKSQAAAHRRRPTELERKRQIREHPITSANLITGMKLPWNIRHIVLAHHEWYNGMGYPRGLAGRAIPLGARILAVVNSFFSMISRRPNRAALDQQDACEELRAQAGRQFDPEVVEVFLDLMKDKAFHTEPRRRRITVISGNDSLRIVLETKLQAAGHQPACFADGESALVALRQNPSDALIIDSQLADGEGCGLLHWIKREDLLSSIPVLMLADADDGGLGLLAHDLGADDIHHKPIRPSELVSRIHALVRRRERLTRAAFSQIHDGEGLRGNLGELNVGDIVRMLHDGRKSATVTVVGSQGHGFLGLDKGELVHARTDDCSGEQAFQAMHSWREGGFLIEHGAATAERTIQQRMDLLVSQLTAADPDQLVDLVDVDPATAVVDSLELDADSIETQTLPAQLQDDSTSADPAEPDGDVTQAIARIEQDSPDDTDTADTDTADTDTADTDTADADTADTDTADTDLVTSEA